MQNRTKAAIGGALALSVTLALGGQALADPPSGVTPKSTDIVGVGSDATQYVVDGLALRVQRADGVVDVAVSRLVEVLGAQVDVDRGRDGIARQQHGTQEGLLGFQGVGRHTADGALAPTGVVD